MPLSTADRLDITELIARHGHLVDAGEFDRIGEVFAEDVVHDLTDFGLGTVTGLGLFRDAESAPGVVHPVGHHVTNTVLTALDDDHVQARSKGIGVQADGTTGSVVYDDVVERRAVGWRITRRRVLARRAPLTA
ncbi:nuclear transport factor 2 family protein [Cryptosporangium phraense]|uniref:Nuclear transport factor 2 family protein n=1 Tax=Cryptosporangium phraense TaxID=2593070 RepID=A0A545ADT5_9ACTN|nr:nuclear transport factor 2 family protein [Cryptosporangium phraense]TQS39491.1 nuclear transport factor 2 family protein [Cryptosporangium phraense]